MELPLVSIKGSVILPRAFMKIVFVSENFRRVAKFVNEGPQKHFLFACIQKAQEGDLLRGKPIIGSVCKLLELKEEGDKMVGFVLGYVLL